jgi:hypothetical protein
MARGNTVTKNAKKQITTTDETRAQTEVKKLDRSTYGFSSGNAGS